MLKINDIVKHETLGEFTVIGSSDQKTLCQSIGGRIYSLATAHLYLKQFNAQCSMFKVKRPQPNVWVHRTDKQEA